MSIKILKIIHRRTNILQISLVFSVVFTFVLFLVQDYLLYNGLDCVYCIFFIFTSYIFTFISDTRFT